MLNKYLLHENTGKDRSTRVVFSSKASMNLSNSNLAGIFIRMSSPTDTLSRIYIISHKKNFLIDFIYFPVDH